MFLQKSGEISAFRQFFPSSAAYTPVVDVYSAGLGSNDDSYRRHILGTEFLEPKPQ